MAFTEGEGCQMMAFRMEKSCFQIMGNLKTSSTQDAHQFTSLLYQPSQVSCWLHKIKQVSHQISLAVFFVTLMP